MPEIRKRTDLEFIVLNKEEWFSLKEIDLGKFQIQEDESSVREKRIIVTNVRVYIEENESKFYYPYIEFYDFEGVKNLRRLPITSNDFRTDLTNQNNESYTLCLESINSIMENISFGKKNNQIKEELDEIIIKDTTSLFNWVESVIVFCKDRPRTKLPTPIIIREIKDFKIKQYKTVRRNFFKIINLSL